MLSYRPFRLEITVTLRLETFHVGTGQQLSLATDSPILRDQKGAPYLPASSLRGVIRSHLEREAPLLGCAPAVIDCLFGNTPARNDKFTGSLGRLQVSDARLQDPAVFDTEVRDHVRVEAKSGAAQNKGKFDSEAATGSHLLNCTLIYEGESALDKELLLVQEALRAIESGELNCGAKSGWGYGRLWAPQIRYLAFDRTQPQALAAFCAHRLQTPQKLSAIFTWPKYDPADALPINPALPPWCWLDMNLELAFEGPVLVRAPIPPTGSKTTPVDAKNHLLYPDKGLVTADQLFIQTGRHGAYYLPGSALRGVLSAQANRIAQTMGRKPLFNDLFGTINTTDGTGQKSILVVEDGSLDGKPSPVYLDHVAIDRLTGFAADSKKFSTCALQSPRFRTRIRIRFTQSTMGALALFGFILRDLCEGWLWVGGGVTRGFGYLPRATIQYVALNYTSDFTVPDTLLPNIKRLFPAGRTRMATPGPIDFYDLNELWAEAETAWKATIPSEGAA